MHRIVVKSTPPPMIEALGRLVSLHVEGISFEGEELTIDSLIRLSGIAIFGTDDKEKIDSDVVSQRMIDGVSYTFTAADDSAAVSLRMLLP